MLLKKNIFVCFFLLHFARVFALVYLCFPPCKTFFVHFMHCSWHLSGFMGNWEQVSRISSLSLHLIQKGKLLCPAVVYSCFLQFLRFWNRLLYILFKSDYWYLGFLSDFYLDDTIHLVLTKRESCLFSGPGVQLGVLISIAQWSDWPCLWHNAVTAAPFVLALGLALKEFRH